MKKGGKIVAIILAIVAALSAAGVGILGASSFKVDDVKRTDRDKYEYRDSDSKKAAAEEPEEPYEDPYESPYDDAEYYGCPNSKRVKKLNLAKKKK